MTLINLANLSNPLFYVELWVHLTFACSIASFALNPFEEWAHDNLSLESFKKIHAACELVRKYGAMSGKRPDLPKLREDKPEAQP